MATSTRSRYFRLLFAVALLFALMTPLTAAAQDPDPHFNVDPDTGAIWGHEWLAESTITITVDGSVAAMARRCRTATSRWRIGWRASTWSHFSSSFPVEFLACFKDGQQVVPYR